MDAFTKLAEKIQGLSKKELQKYTAIFLGVVFCVILGTTYYVYTKSNEYVHKMKITRTLAAKARTLIDELEKIQAKEEQILALFSQSKDFNLNSFFETFCKNQGIKPEDGWGRSTKVLANPQFDEDVLTATFKGQTTQKLVKILEELDKQKLVYLKNLQVKSEKSKQIIFDITIATLRAK